MTNTIQDAMALAGLAPSKAFDLPADGKVHRYRVTGDKAGSRNGWAVLNDGPQPFGAFGSWRTSESHTWRAASSKALTPAERDDIARRTKAMHQARGALQASVQATAAKRAAKLWATARPATHDHPYLEKKRVNSYGLRRLRDMLLVPARDMNGVLHTIQFISSDGTKRFLTGGRINGCYCAIGRVGDTLLLAEGFATAATLYQATGHATAACFTCGNLLAVARALRSKFPRLRLVLCADNDVNTPGNPGLTKAREAARAVGGFLAVPEFKREAYPCPF